MTTIELTDDNPHGIFLAWSLNLCIFRLAALLLLTSYLSAQSFSPIHLPGLRGPAKIVRDLYGIAHVQAGNEHDMAFLQGYVHAQDRLFQMDTLRREGTGTLAELVGPSALPQDVQLRTLGLRRAADASLPLLSDRAKSILQAYSDGLNAYAATHTLPPQYTVLEISKFQPWTPTDSLTVLKLLAFGQSFITDIPQTVDLLTFQQVGQAGGFDGTKLFFEDVVRSAPFDPASTVPDASVPIAAQIAGRGSFKLTSGYLRPSTLTLARQYLKTVEDVPLLRQIRQQRQDGSSNEWAISGTVSRTGTPLLANDPHLSLGEPATWYPIQIQSGEFDVIGVGLPGTPLVSLGHNHFVSWGITDAELDVTDTFQEQLLPDPTSPSGLRTVYQGQLEHVIPVPEVFRQNNVGDGIPDNITTVAPGAGIPAATLIVPRRNNGPIISLDLDDGSAISVQWTGFSGSRELDAALAWNTARNLNDFQRSLPLWTCPPFNLAYSDVQGNIAYFGIGAVPVREDLQAGTVNGLPPFFIRSGGGGNEWLNVIHLQPQQTLPYEILPGTEMPHLINPLEGFFVNANNDPIGVTLSNTPLGRLRPTGGIYYLGYLFNSGFRAGRITNIIRQQLEKRKISFADMQEIQADVVLRDAEFFIPFITQAYDNARVSQDPRLAELAHDPAVSEAIHRFRRWNFSTPTGIPEGYDGGDRNGPPFAHSDSEIANSISATLYAVWRGQFAVSTIDGALGQFGMSSQSTISDDELYLSALRNLLETFTDRQGVGASGINFFQVPDMDAANDRRDYLILKSLRDTLTLLASPAFDDAFGGSTNQQDYRWGKLHRIVFSHILGAPFSVPPAGSAFPQPLLNLPGIPTDGGYETVDAGTHALLSHTTNGFMFDNGPSERFVSELRPEGMHGVSSLPGGTSGVLGSPYYVNLMPQWLTDRAYPQLFTESELEHRTATVTSFVPRRD